MPVPQQLNRADPRSSGGHDGSVPAYPSPGKGRADKWDGNESVRAKPD